MIGVSSASRKNTLQAHCVSEAAPVEELYPGSLDRRRPSVLGGVCGVNAREFFICVSCFVYRKLFEPVATAAVQCCMATAMSALDSECGSQAPALQPGPRPDLQSSNRSSECHGKVPADGEEQACMQVVMCQLVPLHLTARDDDRLDSQNLRRPAELYSGKCTGTSCIHVRPRLIPPVHASSFSFGLDKKNTEQNGTAYPQHNPFRAVCLPPNLQPSVQKLPNCQPGYVKQQL